ncbi:MAG: type II secretion system ATPase GspE [Acidobacteriia bacterium]|nr:type II secretion system ATPase GspE [Terriglobia bacterium]
MTSSPNPVRVAAPKLLGQLLVARGVLPKDDLEKALALQRERKDRIGKILIDLGFISHQDLYSALSEQLGIPRIDAAELRDVPEEAAKLSPGFLKQFLLFPYRVENGTMLLAMADPLDTENIRTVERLVGRRVEVRLATEAEILKALELSFGPEEPPEAEGAGTEGGAGAGDVAAADIEQLRDLASEAPVIRWVNQLIGRALERRASDIHVEPFEKEFRIRYRIDGVLYEVQPPPRELRAAVTSRIKLMAKLNIAEQRLPQDGRIPIRVLGRELDLRVSTLPTLYGESVVMRLLDRSASERFALSTLGFPDAFLEKMEYYLGLPHGLFLVTGPTGSGKSTTLYGSLRKLNTPDRKIITIEDPVEYQLSGVNQIHVNPQIGLTFAAGLRHILRQDPDVIMVGEIRDMETAEIAMRSALTGHLVFSTLHTNDAPSAVTRLTDMGVEHYLVCSSVVAVLAQRLVRVLCEQCKQERSMEAEDLRKQGWPVEESAVTVWRAVGCPHCGQTGYQGRVGIFEFMEMDDDLRHEVMSRADANALREVARRRGLRSLKEDGWLKVTAGVTTPEEVFRVTQQV